MPKYDAGAYKNDEYPYKDEYAYKHDRDGNDAYPSKHDRDGNDGYHTYPANCDGSDGVDGSHTYAALLTPSNNSGALGLAVVNFDDNAGTLTVEIEAKGLTPDVIHPQHIHGFPDGTPSQPPTIALDQDRDGFVETPEGVVAIGPVLLSLTESGQVTNAETPLDFPSADAEGRLHFAQTYQFDLSNEQDTFIFQQLEERVAGRAVELHGLEVPLGEGAGTDFEVHGQDGYIAELPIAGGILHSVSADLLTSLHDQFDLLT